MFHTYVKPKIRPTLIVLYRTNGNHAGDCGRSGLLFAEVFPRFCEWLAKGGYFDKPGKSSFVTCGNWDFKTMLPSLCELDDVTLPDQFKQWIELKYRFCESTGYYSKGLKDVLARLNLPLEGRLHSGIDDVKNTVSIILALQEKYNTQFKITSSLMTSALNLSSYGQNEVTRNVLEKKNT